MKRIVLMGQSFLKGGYQLIAVSRFGYLGSAILDDAVINYEHAEFYHEHTANSQLITFESGGHGMVSKLKAVRDPITLFIEKNH